MSETTKQQSEKQQPIKQEDKIKAAWAFLGIAAILAMWLLSSWLF